MTSLTVSVTVIDGQPRVSSLDIAENFGKTHDNVLKSIKRIIQDLTEESAGVISDVSKFAEGNFSLSEYTDPTGRKLPMYQLTRDAFSLLAMGFTGKAALAWKLRYIEAFNLMEAELLKNVGKKRNARRVQPEQKELPKAEPVLGNREVEAIASLLRLRADVFKVSMELRNILDKAMYRHNAPAMSERQMALAKPISQSFDSFWMAINSNLMAVESLFKAYAEAEKLIFGC